MRGAVVSETPSGHGEHLYPRGKKASRLFPLKEQFRTHPDKPGEISSHQSAYRSLTTLNSDPEWSRAGEWGRGVSRNGSRT